MTIRTCYAVRLAATAFAVCLPFAALADAPAVAAPGVPATRPAVADAEVAAALTKAAAATPKKPAEFVSALQSVAGAFQPVEVGTTVGEAKWNIVTLNRHGKRVDAVRFRTPSADKLADFQWVAVLPPSVEMWYIAPTAGEMTGFKQFVRLDGAALKGHAVPAGHKVFAQQLPATNLKPDTDYILWFTFKDDQPAELHAAINFTKPATKNAKAEVLKSLGLQ